MFHNDPDRPVTVEALEQPVDRAHVIHQLHALRCAVEAELLAQLAAYDATVQWRDDGAPSMEAWTSSFLGVLPETAREMVRVARVLRDLPEIRAVHADGGLNLEQLYAVTRFATPETDAALAAEAPKHTAAALRRMASRAERISRQQAEEQHARRSLRWRWTSDGMLRHSGLLPAADGMALIKAINRLAQQAPRDTDSGERDPYPARCADALRALVGARIAADTDQDRATVVVHVDGSALDGGAGSAHLEAGPGIAVETAKRMLCDGRLQVVAEDENGHPVAIGTTQRTLSPHLARVLRATHEGCAFFGCDNDLFIEFHHMEPHAAGGPTTLDNMIPTCAPHHRLVHEYGWTIQRGDGGAIHIFRPDGTEFLRPLPHLDPGVREHIMRLVPTLQRRADRPAYHRRE